MKIILLLLFALLVFSCSSTATKTTSADLSAALAGEVWNITSAISTQDNKNESSTFYIQRLLFSADKTVILSLYPTESATGIWATGNSTLTINNIVGSTLSFSFTSVSISDSVLYGTITLIAPQGNRNPTITYNVRYAKQ